MEKVKFIDKKSTYIDDSVVLGEKVIIGPNVSLKGNTVIGDNTVIDMNSIIIDSKIGDGNYIISSVVEKGNVILNNNKIGPFCHLKEETIIGSNNEIGSYVEIKKSKLENNNKIKHLAYLGNAKLGSNINVGAGVVFANYNSKTKVKAETIIEDGVSIGSNSTIVAPLKIEENSLIGAGTVVTKNIKKNSLYFIREKEVYKEGYYNNDSGNNK